MTRPEDELDRSLRRLSEAGEADASLGSYAGTLGRLKSLHSVPERDPAAASAGRQAFLDQAAAVPVSRPALSRHRSRTHDGRKELRPMNALIGLLVAVALLFGGGGASAFAAQDALPNDFLYPVKLATEDLQLGLASDPVDRVNLLGNWIDRRFQEMHELVRAGEAIPLEATYRLERHLGLALQTAAQVGDPELTQLLQRLQLRLEADLAAMQQLRSADPGGAALRSAEQATIRTQAEIRGALEDPAAFRIRYGAGRPEDAPAQPELTPGESPQGAPGAGGEGGSGQGNGQGSGPGPGEGQDSDDGQGAGSPGGYGPGDGTCACDPQADGSLLCAPACLQYQNQYQGSQGSDSGYGIGSANCICTPQADGSLICPSTCDPNLFLWSTPGPHGNGSGSGRN
jgi:Domain of unknown function (DUF5667)